MVTSARSRNAKEKQKQHQREDGSEWFFIYGLITVFHFGWRALSRARRAPPQSTLHQKKRGTHAVSENSFSQTTQSFTCTNMHLGGDKMENSSFSRLNRPLPRAAWQPVSTVYLLVGNNIDIHVFPWSDKKKPYKRQREHRCPLSRVLREPAVVIAANLRPGSSSDMSGLKTFAVNKLGKFSTKSPFPITVLWWSVQTQ